jgi:hypothetical protein
MKSKGHIIFAILIFFLGEYNMFSQVVTNLVIRPLNPGSTDQISTSANVYFGTYSCEFKTSSVTINGDTIRVIAKHQVSFLSLTCNATDTIIVGQLQPGSYTLIFYLNEYQSTSPWIYDIDTLKFNVNLATNINSYSKTKISAILHPNPATSIFYIDLNESSDKIIYADIYNMYGQIIISQKRVDEKTLFDLSNEPNGPYFIILSSGDSRRSFKLLKNAP